MHRETAHIDRGDARRAMAKVRTTREVLVRSAPAHEMTDDGQPCLAATGCAARGCLAPVCRATWMWTGLGFFVRALGRTDRLTWLRQSGARVRRYPSGGGLLKNAHGSKAGWIRRRGSSAAVPTNGAVGRGRGILRLHETIVTKAEVGCSRFVSPSAVRGSESPLAHLRRSLLACLL